LLGGDGGVFAAHHVDPCVRSGGGIEQDFAARNIDQLIARAQDAAFAADGVIVEHAEGFERIVEPHVEPVGGRRVAGGAEPVGQRIAHQPAALSRDRGHIDRRQPLWHRRTAAAGIHRRKAAGG
jgi:hypothetical protein